MKLLLIVATILMVSGCVTNTIKSADLEASPCAAVTVVVEVVG